MKNFKFLTFAFISIVAVSTIFYMNSCNPDPCKDVVCQNGGTCVDGTCGCLTGYEGTNCETEMRTKFLLSASSFTESGTTDSSYNHVVHNYSNTYNMTITKGSDVNTILIENLGNYGCSSGSYTVTGTMTASTAFTIASQAVCGTTFSGSGTINSNGKISITYTATYPDGTVGHPAGSTVTDNYTATQN